MPWQRPWQVLSIRRDDDGWSGANRLPHNRFGSGWRAVIGHPSSKASAVWSMEGIATSPQAVLFYIFRRVGRIDR